MFLCRKSSGGFRGFFSRFMGVFWGVLGNVDGKAWCFCGEVVVRCVANVVRKTVHFEG